MTINLTDDEVAFLLMAVENVQFSGDIKNRERVREVLQLAEAVIEKLQSSPPSTE